MKLRLHHVKKKISKYFVLISEIDYYSYINGLRKYRNESR